MKTGDKVTVVVRTPVATTEEECVISDVTDTEIYIENLSTSFDITTGKKTYSMPGTSCYIKELTNEAARKSRS